jgi:hypothetical protein
MEAAEKVITERFESRKIDKWKRIMIFCIIGLVLVTISKISNATSTNISGIGWWLDTLLLGVLPAFLFIQNIKRLNQRSGQFIEWTADSIIFKLRNEASAVTIQRSQIEKVTIQLEIIEVTDKANQKFVLDFTDFDKYEDRLKIKENFKNEIKQTWLDLSKK